MLIRRGALALPLLLLASLLPVPGAAEETILIFERQTRTIEHRAPGQPGSVASDTSRTDVTVVLGDRRLSVYDAEGVWVYNFDKNRVQRLNFEARTYSDWSLFGFVAFNEMELTNRLALRARIMAERPGAAPSVLELETLFSMKAPSTRPGTRESIADSSRGDQVRFFINRSLAVAARLSENALEPARQSMFERFLLYRCHVHPQARRALVRLGRVPKQLFYRFLDFDRETQVMLTLKEVSSAPEANEPMAASRRSDISDPEHKTLARLLADCHRCDTKPDPSWIETSRRFETESLSGGRYLDAALAQAERAMACETSIAWPADIEARARADTRLTAYRAGQQWKDSAGAVAALQKLEGIDRSGLEKAHVLDLSSGRARLGAGDREGGTQMLLRAVSGNPCLAGAWQELARGYLESYEPILAWTCFDAGRAVAPAGCVALSEGERLERGLLARHPEFFE